MNDAHLTCDNYSVSRDTLLSSSSDPLANKADSKLIHLLETDERHASEVKSSSSSTPMLWTTSVHIPSFETPKPLDSLGVEDKHLDEHFASFSQLFTNSSTREPIHGRMSSNLVSIRL